MQVERLREQLHDAERRVRQAGQPQSHLVEQLSLGEQQRQQLQLRLDAAEASHAERERALASSQELQRALKTDLERVLRQRGSLDALRSTLMRLA